MHHRRILVIFLFSLCLNFLGSYIQTVFDLPLFFDTVGTFLCAVVIGPWIGGLAGLLPNTLKGMFFSTLSIPFGLVNLVVGIVAGYLVVWLKGFHKWYAPLVVGVVAALVAPLVAAPIAAYLFGGISAHGIDRFVVSFIEGGHSLLSSAFWGRVPLSFVDKLLSAYFIYGLLLVTPESFYQISGEDPK
jgi:energy-coupling factor transport system substrate-specific component